MDQTYISYLSRDGSDPVVVAAADGRTGKTIDDWLMVADAGQVCYLP